MMKRLFAIPGYRLEVEVKGRKLTVIEKGPLKKIIKNAALKRLIERMGREKLAAVLEDKLVISLYLPPIPSEAFKRVIKNQIRKRLGLSYGPDAATLAVTEKCNCRCFHCSAFRRGKTELSTEEWKNVIDQLLSMGTYNITFTGGEPLLREDLSELIRHVDKEKAITQVFTNGYLLNDEKVEELVKSGLYAVQVSLDSPDPKEHDKLRGVNGLFDKAVEGIRIAKEKGLLVGISSYIDHDGLKDGKVEKLISLAEQLEVNELTIFDLVPTGKLLNHDLFLTEKDREKLVQIYLKENEKDYGPRVSIMSFVNSPLGAGCFGGDFQIHITNSGELTPCDFTPLTFGNVRKESLKKIWRKIRRHPEYGCWRESCRMQNPAFRRKYIERIPADAELPYPIDRLDQAEN